ncbi:sulfotransferase [Colwelliaceae bacterium 6471]
MNLTESLTSAENAHRNGNFDVAKQKYLQIINTYNHNDAIYGLATLYSQHALFDDALPLFETALQREPLAADIALNFSLCLQAANQKDKAISVINTIKSNLPNDQHILIAFAHLALNLNQPSLVIDILKLYELSDLQSFSLTASAYMALNDWKSAKQLWERLSKKSPSTPIFWEKLSLCAAKLREYALANSTFETFMTLSPKSSINHLKYADLCIISKDLATARTQLNYAISLNDVSLTRYELEASICRLEHNVEQAIVAANKTISLAKESHTAWEIKLELSKEYEECVTNLHHLYTDSISNTYENQHNLFTLAKAYEKLENFDLAFRCFEKANKLQGDQQQMAGLGYIKEQVVKDHMFYKALRASPINDLSAQTKNIFIVGMPRSGTTLMDRIISQHPSVTSCGESEALATAVDHRANKNKHSVDFNWDTFLKGFSSEIFQYYSNEMPTSSDIIVDKMPHNFLYVGAMVAIFKNVKIIQMRRTPEDLALSLFSHPFALHHNYATDLEDTAHSIYHANKLMDFWCKQYPENVMDVNYEDLAKIPLETAKRIYNFCNLTWDDDYLNFHKKNVSSFTFSEVQVRQPINTSKINFSRHYEKQFSPFRKAYNALVQSKN